MGFLSQLDVVNEMLAALGESPLNTLDEEHPLVAAGLRMLKVAAIREQAKSWWFNKEWVTLQPDADSGYIYTPADAIRIDPTKGSLNYVLRGRRLYKAYAPQTTDPYKFDASVSCWLVRNLDFDDLPPTAQLLVSYAAQLDFCKAYDADGQKMAEIKLQRDEAMSTLRTEHIRNVNANLLDTPSVRDKMWRIAPQSAGYGTGLGGSW